ncbi:MAG TPA: hypothetical protein VEQ42_05745, partial [Pyrinomonadaceae bacterium]|nr:hypothetical protein [Pyrinomonadaceae bacterium]
MSYLDLPRLHFAGVFVAQPSTVNNTPQNFDPNVTNPDPGWNPNGAAGWQFKNCTVRSVVYSEGRVCEGASEEAIIGSPVQGTDSPSVAKLVDLDSEQQMVSEIWGFQVVVGLPGGPDSVRGDFEVAAFADIWFRAVDAGQGGDAPMGASYQSVLKNLQWADTLRSPFLKELRKASPDRLSIKFNLDGINMDSTSPTFCQGRITGTIGPASADEPEHFVAARLLRSAPGTSTDPNLQPATLQGTPPASPMFFAPAKVDETRGRVVLDVGNSLSTTTPAGPPNPALGNLALALLPPEGPPALLGQIRYQLPGW